MSRFSAPLRRLLRDRRGAMLVEYSSLTLLIALAAVTLFTQLGQPG